MVKLLIFADRLNCYLTEKSLIEEESNKLRCLIIDNWPLCIQTDMACGLFSTFKLLIFANLKKKEEKEETIFLVNIAKN